MNFRAHSAAAVAKRKLFESLIHPGLYIALTLGFGLAYLFSVEFVHAIDASGFNYQLDPLYNLVGGTLAAAFGGAFPAKLFADGPFLFALHLAALPTIIFLASSSVYRFGTEKSSGAIELLCYGPSDGTSYFAALFAKDALLTLGSLLCLLGFLFLTGLLDNIAFPGTLLLSLLILFAMALSLYAYGVLAAVLADSASTGLALFGGGLLLFLAVLVASQSMLGGSAQGLVRAATWVIKWLSPFFYWLIATRGTANGEAGWVVLGLAGQFALTATVLVASNYIVRFRGVRA